MASIVFKVKYEDTLRRFNVPICGDRRLDLSMEGLRLKVSSLFNLPTDFRLIYEDEDDDLVTLVDDDDLYDLVRQGLNPVRIIVHLNSDQGARSFSAPSSQSAAQSPSPQDVQPDMYPSLPEALKSVQEPLAQALSKLSLDLSSKAASTSPILADLFDGLSKIGQLCVNAALSNSGNTSISSSVQGDNGSEPNSDGRKQKYSVNEGMKNDDIDAAIHPQPIPKSTWGTEIFVRHPPYPSFSADKGKNASCESSSNKMSPSGATKNGNVTALKMGLDVGAEFLGSTAISASGKNSNKAAADKSRGSSIGTPLTRGKICKPIHLSNKRFHKADSVGPVFHKGVRCDGCGVHPITGPRFKSNVKYDFDLCSICFSRMGNDVDYTRIDFPLVYRHPWSFNAPDMASSCPYMKRPNAPEYLRSRFDSLFIMDVNVVDETTMAPSTPFTKIWRMRNSGKVPWKHGLNLLWVGGDRFSSSDSAEIPVPVNGVDVASDLDIAVNFIAPDLPGRYISYWRMAEPSGHMFGQRVWVQIQVDSSLDLTRESSPMLNLNLPPESNETAFPHVSNVKSEPGLGVEVSESSAPPIPEQDYSHFPINNDLLSANHLLYPSYAAPSSSVPQVSSTERPKSPRALSHISYPKVDSNANHVPQASAPLALYPTIDVGSNLDNNNCHEQYSEKSEFKKPGIEEKMLKELEQMGFMQTELNKEVLQMNDYDLQRSVDALCDVSKWDPILKELQVMGFKDKELNKKLLVKNNGSITRVVIDLIADQ
ncbi:hypothetical protein RND81_10G232700 [Saponaria officinalis]|uniref:Protein NBR1 homolog n=1 Tax=Saponaria officinalis TaxID=3572 RepID=A0AAW1I701_SAPOF